MIELNGRTHQHCSQCIARVVIGLLCTLLLIATNAAFADAKTSITLSTDTTSIYLGDSVVLDIESTGLLEPLDVSELKQRPGFLRETVGTRIAVIEGKVVEIASRRMEFIPIEEGVLIYGPLTGEGSQGRTSSGSVSIDVLPAINSVWQPNESDIDTNIAFSNERPVVGEQIVVDVKLRHKYPIANEQILMPEFNNFDILVVHEQRRTIETESAETWRQIAWRFLLHPKNSGVIDIQPMRWSGTMIKSRSQRGNFDRTINIVPLQVRAAPKDRPDWWLPATSVQISDSWSKEVKTLSAGDEIIRTITLSAKNILGNQVPDIEPLPSRALTSTLIRSTREHKLNNDHTVATGMFEFRMVAQSPIPVFLDTVRVPWWNTETNTHEEAIIPARRINIGLPDRADLLADLAVNNSRLTRWMFTLRSYARWQPLLIALGLLVTTVALFPLLRDGVRHHQLMRLQRRQIRKLETLQKKGEWQALYTTLNKLADENVINTRTANHRDLLESLHQILFGNNNAAAKQLERTKISLAFTAHKPNQKRALVASL